MPQPLPLLSEEDNGGDEEEEWVSEDEVRRSH
jgi:hypothetical protein